MRSVIILASVAACGGGSSGGGKDGSVVDTPKAAHSGYVSAQSIDAMNVPNTPITSGTASAAFYTSGASCVVMQQVGACSFEMCTTALTGATSAGEITIAGGAETIVLAPNSNGTYSQFTASERLFAGGETLTFTAAGASGGIPAFTKSLTAPARTTITSPTKPAMSLAVNRAQDLTVGWTGGTGQVQVSLIGQTVGTTLLCRFDASAGTGTIPAAALAMLPAGMGGFAMATIVDTEQDAGDWAVDVSGFFNAVWPDDSIVSGPTVVQ